MTYSFAGVTNEVEDALSFKARNADPRIRPFYSRILYTWYIDHGDYRNGAYSSFKTVGWYANRAFDLQPH